MFNREWQLERQPLRSLAMVTGLSLGATQRVGFDGDDDGPMLSSSLSMNPVMHKSLGEARTHSSPGDQGLHFIEYRGHKLYGRYDLAT